jgi:hypothetical protein
MFLKTFGVLAPVVLGGVYFAGGFTSAYSRDVGKPQAEVMSALADLDITEQPGAPGTDPSMSGGVRPLFKLERGTDSMTWFVMSGDKVAMRMVASFEPLEGGAQTRVRTSVSRGDAPEEFVSPAFRSTSVTLGLFSAAVEGELNGLTRTRTASDAECRELYEKLMGGNSPEDRMRQMQDSEQRGVGAVINISGKLRAVRAELERNGCDTSMAATNRRIKAMQNESASAGSPAQPEVSFEPGKPMIDLSKKGQ